MSGWLWHHRKTQIQSPFSVTYSCGQKQDPFMWEKIKKRLAVSFIVHLSHSGNKELDPNAYRRKQQNDFCDSLMQ